MWFTSYDVNVILIAIRILWWMAFLRSHGYHYHNTFRNTHFIECVHMDTVEKKKWQHK